MTILLYILATIGALVTGLFGFLLVAWLFICLVAKLELRRKSRIAALTYPEPS